MRMLLIAIATAGLAASPAVAQAQSPVSQAPEKGKMVEKVVCEKIPAERTTGSRLGSTTKVCKTVMVPADEATKRDGRAGASE